jgi:hypothetical protein
VSALAGGGQADAAPVSFVPIQIPGAVAFPQSSQASITGNESGLESVYCTMAANCWAVGSTQRAGTSLNEVLHWTGRKWVKISVPDPGGTATGASNELNSVRCTSATNCWAVGSYAKKGADLAQALHWTGKKWSLVATPTPGGTLPANVNILTDVACSSAGSCWAAGDYGALNSTDLLLNLLLHWNGKKWSQVSAPNPDGAGDKHLNGLLAVRCAGPADCWAVGTGANVGSQLNFRDEALHWNGKKWLSVAVPNPAGVAKEDVNQLDGLACTSASNCWATGVYGKAADRALNLALHWNGKRWSRVATPNPEGTQAGASNILVGVNCSSARNCWAVGSISGAESATTATKNEALHWNGTAWSKAPVPQPGGTADGDLSELNSVRCSSPANCWAVGDQQRKNGPNLRQLLHWTGVKWVSS